MNDFQEKCITWQGEDNVLVTTVLQYLSNYIVLDFIKIIIKLNDINKQKKALSFDWAFFDESFSVNA